MKSRTLSLARILSAFVLASTLSVPPVSALAAAPDAGPSASEIMSRTEVQARSENKKILLDFRASWCGNCKLYDRFLGDPQMHKLLGRVFVFASMTTGEHSDDTNHVNTPGGPEYEATVGGKDAGWPYIIMLSADGKPIVDSFRPDRKAKSGKSNTGYPDAPEEVDWFVEMLRRAAPSLNQQELASIHAWLTAHSTTQGH